MDNLHRLIHAFVVGVHKKFSVAEATMNFRTYIQEVLPSKTTGRFATNERVNAALEDIANGNRPITSTALIQCRLAEIAAKRHKEAQEFEAWARKAFFVP